MFSVHENEKEACERREREKIIVLSSCLGRKVIKINAVNSKRSWQFMEENCSLNTHYYPEVLLVPPKCHLRKSTSAGIDFVPDSVGA